MKYIRYVLIIFIFLFTINVHASCETKEFARLKSKAKEVQFSYELVEDNSGDYFTISYDITAVNLDPELKVLIINDYYLDDYVEFKYNDSKESTLKYFTPGDKVVITVKAHVANDCSGDTLLTKTISLPYYNDFYFSNECQTYPDFEYCKSKLLDKNVSSTEIYDKYYAMLNNENNKIDNNINIIKDYNYVAVMVVVVIVIILIITTIIIIAKKKYKRSQL